MAAGIREGCGAWAPWPVQRPVQEVYPENAQPLACTVDVFHLQGEHHARGCARGSDRGRRDELRRFVNLHKVDDDVRKGKGDAGRILVDDGIAKTSR
jgi:hypothetical protein